MIRDEYGDWLQDKDLPGKIVRSSADKVITPIFRNIDPFRYNNGGWSATWGEILILAKEVMDDDRI